MLTTLVIAIRKILTALLLLIATASVMVAVAEPPYRTASVVLASVLAVLALVVSPGRLGRKRARSKALYTTLYGLADAVENKEATIDASIKAVFRDIRDSIEGLADDTEDEAIANELEDLAFDLTRIVGEDRSEAQALAHNKRVAAKTEIVRQLKARRAATPPRA